MGRILDLEKQITEDTAAAIREEIDREIIWSMFENVGWSRVTLNYTPESDSLHDWLLACQHNYKAVNNDFIFENEQEAAWFKLRWQK